jgi:hypothetical protein
MLLAYAFYRGSFYFPNLLKTIYLDLSTVLFLHWPKRNLMTCQPIRERNEMRSVMVVVLAIALSSSAFWNAGG